MLPFTIALRPGVPIQEQVVFAVTRAAVTGQIRAGDPFPSVRALSQALRINPNTAHKIVATLVEDRILAVLPGIGTVVAYPAQTPAAGWRAQLEDDAERLVVEARRGGLSLQALLDVVRRRWTGTMDVPATRRRAR